jgi:hypothetical protein
MVIIAEQKHSSEMPTITPADVAKSFGILAQVQGKIDTDGADFEAGVKYIETTLTKSVQDALGSDRYTARIELKK